MDDIEDDAQLRRGKPGALDCVPSISLEAYCQVRILAAHKIYGIPQTINTANYVYFLAYQELLTLRNSPRTSAPRKDLDASVTGMSCIILAMPIGSCFYLLEELLSLHRGQGLEILWQDSL